MLLALSLGGCMLFDGLHGFVTGKYVTPESGEYGPWATFVEAAGLVPDSNLMRGLFVVLGRRLLIGLAWGTLWYAAVGTVHCVLVLGLLFGVPSLRGR
jgi:hypothetical protein